MSEMSSTEKRSATIGQEVLAINWHVSVSFLYYPILLFLLTAGSTPIAVILQVCGINVDAGIIGLGLWMAVWSVLSFFLSRLLGIFIVWSTYSAAILLVDLRSSSLAAVSGGNVAGFFAFPFLLVAVEIDTWQSLLLVLVGPVLTILVSQTAARIGQLKERRKLKIEFQPPSSWVWQFGLRHIFSWMTGVCVLSGIVHAVLNPPPSFGGLFLLLVLALVATQYLLLPCSALLASKWTVWTKLSFQEDSLSESL